MAPTHQEIRAEVERLVRRALAHLQDAKAALGRAQVELSRGAR